MTAVHVIVVVDSPASLSDVKSACEAHGLTQIQEMPNLHMLKGTIEDERVAELRKIPNVSSVEPERVIQLPPPSSPIQ